MLSHDVRYSSCDSVVVPRRLHCHMQVSDCSTGSMVKPQLQWLRLSNLLHLNGFGFPYLVRIWPSPLRLDVVCILNRDASFLCASGKHVEHLDVLGLDGLP
jgi:hypothetical protein